MKYKLKEIWNIFFPNSFSQKYTHIGYSYPGVPSGWVNIVENIIIEIEKLMWPQRYIPFFIKRLIHYFATGNSVVGIKSVFFYKIRRYLTNNQTIMDIKDKYASLRIYGYYGKEIESLIDKAENLCEETCERCGSTEDTKIVGKGWIENLCINCRKK